MRSGVVGLVFKTSSVLMSLTRSLAHLLEQKDLVSEPIVENTDHILSKPDFQHWHLWC